MVLLYDRSFLTRQLCQSLPLGNFSQDKNNCSRLIRNTITLFHHFVPQVYWSLKLFIGSSSLKLFIENTELQVLQRIQMFSYDFADLNRLLSTNRYAASLLYLVCTIRHHKRIRRVIFRCPIIPGSLKVVGETETKSAKLSG